jgi:hypothetical protein
MAFRLFAFRDRGILAKRKGGISAALCMGEFTGPWLLVTDVACGHDRSISFYEERTSPIHQIRDQVLRS